LTPRTDISAAFESALAWWEDAGVDTPAIPAMAKPKLSGKPALSAKPPPAATAAPQTPKQTDVTANVDTQAIAQSAPTLDALRDAIAKFDAGDLSANATQSVFCRGNPEADIMVIGEAPGADEDRAGKPFVGKAGQLLDKIFASIGLGENDVYITNVVNYRPPGNRKPSAAEIALFRPFVTRHVQLAKPKFLVLVGGVSLEAMLGQKGIMKTRGQWQDYEIGEGQTIPALPVYHPAFLLRRPELKADMWRDMLSLKGRIEED